MCLTTRLAKYGHQSVSALLLFFKSLHKSSFCLLTLQVFRPRTPPEAIDLVSQLLEYTPSRRIAPLEACAHGFFDELRDPNTRLPIGRELPPLFNFTSTGRWCKQNYLTNSLTVVFTVHWVDCCLCCGVNAVQR